MVLGIACLLGRSLTIGVDIVVIPIQCFQFDSTILLYVDILPIAEHREATDLDRFVSEQCFERRRALQVLPVLVVRAKLLEQTVAIEDLEFLQQEAEGEVLIVSTHLVLEAKVNVGDVDSDIFYDVGDQLRGVATR